MTHDNIQNTQIKWLDMDCAVQNIDTLFTCTHSVCKHEMFNFGISNAACVGIVEELRIR